ncbi:MAG: hypothetical protein NTZ51_05485 [Proteobacteria bacterium]|nr:hypothetical protein [Pseudomonadota bacterium]
MKRIYLALLSIALVFSLFAVNSISAEEKELQTSIVRIKGYEGVTPLNLFITPGTIVVWINDFKQASVKVEFPNKKVTLACQSPVNFSLSKESTFVSNPIPFGGVASLCFIEQGTFDYIIERSQPPMSGSTSDRFRFEGKIVVKTK